jgi:hypothetical protein
LLLEDRDGRDIEPGDIVCYPDLSGTIVAHRVIGVRADRLLVRGDAFHRPEEIEPGAVIYRVVRVEHRLFSYDTDGAVGEAVKRLVVRHPALHRVLYRAARTANDVRRSLFRRG